MVVSLFHRFTPKNGECCLVDSYLWVQIASLFIFMILYYISEEQFGLISIFTDRTIQEEMYIIYNVAIYQNTGSNSLK